MPSLGDRRYVAPTNDRLSGIGDSAKAFAVSGLEVLGRDRFGVFPIRGKLINVADIDREKVGVARERYPTVYQVAENVEIGNLMTILGLKFGKDYSLDEEFRTLRYGSVVVLADQVSLLPPLKKVGSGRGWLTHQGALPELLPPFLARTSQEELHFCL